MKFFRTILPSSLSITALLAVGSCWALARPAASVNDPSSSSFGPVRTQMHQVNAIGSSFHIAVELSANLNHFRCISHTGALKYVSPPLPKNRKGLIMEHDSTPARDAERCQQWDNVFTLKPSGELMFQGKPTAFQRTGDFRLVVTAPSSNLRFEHLGNTLRRTDGTNVGTQECVAASSALRFLHLLPCDHAQVNKTRVFLGY